MGFQPTVNPQMGFGIPGELYDNAPVRAQPVVLDTTDAANNVIGRALSWKTGATGSWAAGSAGAADPKPLKAEAGGDGPFAGILANPKAYALGGTLAGGTLAPSMTLPNNTVAEAVSECELVVNLGAASNPGDPVYYQTADGALVRTAPGAAQPVNTVGPIGEVVRFANAGASLAVMWVFKIPTLPPSAP